MEPKSSVFYDYPDTQWIVIAAVGLSLIFQGLFYIYFFCSFKRNYTRNLTLKSYRKQKFSLRNGSLSNDFEDGEMSTDEPDTRPSVSNKSLETRAESVRNQKQPDNFITKVHPEVSQIQKKKHVEDLNRDPEFVSELKTKVNKNNETKTVKLKSSKNNTEIKVEDLDTSENDLENTHVAVKSVSRDKEPEIKILNEKRENTVQKVGGRKIHKVKLRQKVAQAVNETAKDKKTAPEMELYEVYFDKNSENPLSTKTKTNIQKIKFKRRSPSLSSF